MPLQKLQFRPGVNREGTTLANEGGWFECDKIRFRSGYPEKLGGWVQDSGTYYNNNVSVAPPAGSYWGVCRSMWNWNSLAGNNYLSIGTNLKFYIQNGPNGLFYDVTPERNPSGTTITGTAFTTFQGTTTVYVNAPGHGAQNGDFVTISGVVGSVNGIPYQALNKEFRIVYIDSNQFQITTSSPATTGGSPSTPTGSATLTYQITTGLDTYTVATGWGAGYWGGFVPGTETDYLATALPSTTLSAIASASATTLSVVDTTGFDSPSGSVWVNQEFITYTGTTGTTLTGCTRGATSPNGVTIAVIHPVGSTAVANITSIDLTDATGFASTNGTIVIDSELITYASITTNTLNSCVRGASGSTPASHVANSVVTQVTTSGSREWTGWGEAASTGGVGQQLRLWSQSNYGEDLIFNPRGSALYYWLVDANPNIFNRGTIIKAGDAVPGSSPTIYYDTTTPSVANLVVVSDSSRFVIAMGTNDPTGVYATAVQDPLQIRWSQQEEFYTWTPSATNQAGDYRLSRGSEIVTAQQTRQEILVFTDAAVYSMQYLGPPYVWGFQIMGDNISIAGPNVVSTANNVTYWMGTDKFYMYSGRVETLPCTLRQYVFDNINFQQSYQFFSGTNEGYNEVWWFYCSVTGTNADGTQGSGTPEVPNTLVDKYVIFNYLERTWYYGSMARTYWLDSPLREEPMAAGYNGQLLYHETGNDDGTTTPPSPIVSYCQSSDFDIGDGHNFGLVSRIIPDLTFDGSDVASPTATFTVRPRQNPGANYGTSNSPSVDSSNNYINQRTYNVQQFTQYVYVRVRGRQMAFRVGSDELGVSWQLGAPRLEVRPDGRR